MLRELIVTGELKPGDSIIETDLSAQLGVSRAPLREALQILNTEGLIEIIPYHKTTVRRLTRYDIHELYGIRSVLEAFGMRQIIERGDSDAIETLKGVYEEMVAAADAGNAAEASQRDHEFHNMIITLSQHSLLISMWAGVSQRVRQVLALRDMVRTNIREIARSHQVLIDVLEEGDVDKAAGLIEAHIMDASDLIVEVWEDGDALP